MKFKYKINCILIAVMITSFSASQASIITLNLTGLWTVQGLPNITITAEVDSNTTDLRSDIVVGKYTVNNFQVFLNTEYASPLFNNLTLIANPQNSFIDISQNYLSFYGSFYGSSSYTLPNGIQALNYQFMAHSSDIVDNKLSNLTTITSINTDSLGYISTQIGDYSSDIWNSKINVSSDSLTTVPAPAAIWLFGGGLGFLALSNHRKRTYSN